MPKRQSPAAERYRTRHRRSDLSGEEFLPNRPTAFEAFVTKLKLKEGEWAKSDRLKKWVFSHRDSRYVPESLLQAWDMRLRADKL
jgi:hypothetical protein